MDYRFPHRRDGRGESDVSRFVSSKVIHKTAQLCKQVHQTLDLTLGGLSDDALLDLTLDSVEPSPDASRLLATFSLSPVSTVAPAEALAALESARGPLRSAVAAGITRKRAPEIAFLVRPAGGGR